MKEVDGKRSLEIYIICGILFILICIWQLLEHGLDPTLGVIIGSGTVYLILGIYYWRKGQMHWSKN
ncbi:MAG: hypothetical protein KRP56_06370 [Candidatus Methanogranum gryphiswaldense]|nr:MAG: hypothetical protein KRP56_06370 [Candidatus Methanogranum sp. U3.2.1]